MQVNGQHYRTVWFEKGLVKMINQPLLPHKFEIYTSPHHQVTAQAIRSMIVRGAGAIGSSGGYGLAQAALEAPDEGFLAYVQEAYRLLAETRPTAQNLFYALEHVKRVIMAAIDNPARARELAVQEAERIADEDIEACRRIGKWGSSLIRPGMRVLTHCNAGWLAFTDWGSALAPLYQAKREGKTPFVWVDETRPRCQGAHLTAWELSEEGLEFKVIADNAAGYYMARGEVDLVITGSDRIAANGDVANKIGTYTKAVLARENGIPFYIAAPLATIDWGCSCGSEIPIEERDESEVTGITGRTESGEVIRVSLTPPGVHAGNPAFDVTPARFVTGIITEQGIFSPADIKEAQG